MQLYHWHSEALKAYTGGDILAIGASLEDARANARTLFHEKARERWGWLDDKYPEWSPDEDDKAEYDKIVAGLEADIAAKPAYVGVAALINGGE